MILQQAIKCKLQKYFFTNTGEKYFDLYKRKQKENKNFDYKNIFIMKK